MDIFDHVTSSQDMDFTIKQWYGSVVGLAHRFAHKRIGKRLRANNSSLESCRGPSDANRRKIDLSVVQWRSAPPPRIAPCGKMVKYVSKV